MADGITREYRHETHLHKNCRAAHKVTSRMAYREPAPVDAYHRSLFASYTRRIPSGDLAPVSPHEYLDREFFGGDDHD